MNKSGNFKNILIMKPGAIGDLLQLTPIIRSLHEKYPDARVTMLVGSSATAELFKYNLHVHETLIFDKKGEHKSFSSLLQLWNEIRGRHYDLLINFQRSNLKLWFLASAAFPCRVLVYHKARTRAIHAVANYFEAIAPLDIHSSNLTLELYPGPDDRVFAAQIISSRENKKGPLIALNPGASHPVNRWSTDRFAALADLLVQQLSADIIIIGGAEDILLAKEIASKSNSRPLIMAGKAGLLQLAALLEQCDLLVSGDTGPLHLATAVGTRAIALFGAADHDRTGPIGTGHHVIRAKDVLCAPCRCRTCGNKIYLECMEKISARSVFDAASDMLRNGSAIKSVPL